MLAWVLNLDFAGSGSSTTPVTTTQPQTFLLLGAGLSFFIAVLIAGVAYVA